MPTLKTYTAQVRPAPINGGRRASGDDFGVNTGAGIAKAVASGVNAYVTDTEESESRKVLVSQAEIRAKYAKRLDDAAINGEDLGKIKEELTSEMSTISEGLVTRKGSDTAAIHAANTTAVFDNQANNIAVSRAYSAAITEGAKFTEALCQQVIRSPSALAQAEADVDAFAATLTRVSPENKNKLVTKWKQDLNVAAVTRATQLDPEGTKAAVEAGQYSLSADQRIDAIKYAGTVQSANRAAKALERADADYQERKRDEEATDGYVKRIVGGSVPAREILNDPNLSARSREHLILFQESRAKALASGDRKSNPAVVRDLYLSAIAPEGTPGKIYTIDPIFQAVKDGKINTTDADRLRGIVAGQKDENGRTFGSQLYGRLQVVQGALRGAPQYQAQPELAAQIVTTLAARAERAAEEARKAGKSPTSILDPDSKDYFFKPGMLKAVEDDVQQQMRAAMPKSVDLRVNPEAAATVEINQTFVDPNGVTRVMTPQLKEALKKNPPPAAATNPLTFDPLKGGLQPPTSK